MDVTLGLAVLLAAGMLAAKIGQMLKLPSVTGYILAGLLLGPSGFGIVTVETVGNKLHHFTQIALMLIAFGIGEQIEVKRLRQSARSIGVIGVFEATGALVFVASASFFVARLCGLDLVDWGTDDYLAMALLLGAVSVATAPATTLHVMRELRAKGPLTSTLMAVVAIDNGLAIIFFGLAMSFAGQIAAAGSGSLAGAVLGSVMEISFSLTAGLITGLVISFVLHHLKRQDEMLTAGLALLLLSGEGCRFFHLSPLLAGMAAGFTVINRVTRDVRLFRALNAFEPPIYVLFFTLA
ncbi:MAG: cation:proton antiporter, partial [Desulfobulbaceae bacterium]|nr:cation:proton antiporter [Desulfobulbaceae bacterium]